MKKLNFVLCIALMMACCIITYSNHFYNGFHFDDSHTILNNVYIRDIHNIPLFFKDGSTFSSLPQNQSYRPVVVASLAIDYWLGNGYDVFYFHLSTFILFMLQGILMIFLLLKLFNISLPHCRRNSYLAIIGVSWYMLHPAIAETVNYIIARSDLQSSLFVIMALVLYMYSSVCRKFYLYLFPVVIASLAKPTGVMFGPILWVYIFLFEEKLSFKDILKIRHFTTLLKTVKKAMPALICCLIVYWWQAKLTPQTWQPGGSSRWLYLITQPFVILHYFKMFFIPDALSADTDWHLLAGVFNWRFFAGCFFILTMLLSAIITSRTDRLKPISFGIAWYFLALIPTSSIIPLSEVLNDHRMYFPFVGLLISVVWTVNLLIIKYKPLAVKYIPGVKPTALLILFLTLSVYAYATYQRNEVWHTEESLWHDVTIKSPENGRGLMNYGLTKMAKGDYRQADNYFTRALKLLPYYATIYVNLGILKAATGNTAQAEQYFKQGLVYGSNYPDTHFFYAKYLYGQRRYLEAADHLKKTLSLSPAYPDARLLLMDLYQNRAEWDSLETLANSSLTLLPGNTIIQHYLIVARQRKNDKIDAATANKTATAEYYLNLSLTFFNRGEYNRCIAACNKALIFKPDYDAAYNNLCAAYNNLKQWGKAIAAAKMGLKINPENQLLKNNMAVSLKALQRSGNSQ